MKTIFHQTRNDHARIKISFVSPRILCAAVCVLVLACDGAALAQTSAPPAATNSVMSTNATRLEDVTVYGRLDEARINIATDVGANSYTISSNQLAAQAQGLNAPVNQVLLRAPGVSQDSFGQIHVRNEHAFLQYRINDVILPEGIALFGQELDTRFIGSLELLDGALPAEYGFRNAGVVDIHTKSGAFNPGGDVSMYGGSYDTYRPSFEYGGQEGKLNYYLTGSYEHTGLGIENPTGSTDAIHDNADKYKAFGYFSYLLDDTSRISAIFSASYSYFQIPNSPGQAFAEDPNNPGNPFPVPTGGATNSTDLNENQTERNYYGVVAYQKMLGDLNFQLAGFSRFSSILFRPDYLGDLFFDGSAGRVDRSILTHGLQGGASYDLTDKHTLRAGFQFSASHAIVDNSTGVFGVNPPPTTGPFNIIDNNNKWGYQYGFYAQDEWKITDKWTLNFGSRFDVSEAFINESAFGPRINTVYKPTDKTTLHAGYAYYFTPPPLESVQQGSIGLYANTTGEPPNPVPSDPVKSEQSHYFDAGITQVVAPGLKLGLDGYYKIAYNQLDDGQFGQGLIITPFNYHDGILYGVELSANYQLGDFSAYGNFAYSQEKAKNIDSAQFNFDPGDLAYIHDHYIFTDHNQTFTGSAGASYKWMGTLVYADMLYGNGLRTGGLVPNGSKLPDYVTANLGISHDFKIGKNLLTARFDIVNVFDKVYQIRSGSGVGVGAPQFGARRGFYGTVSYAF